MCLAAYGTHQDTRGHASLLLLLRFGADDEISGERWRVDVAVNDMLAIESPEGKVKAEALHLLLDAVSAKLAKKVKELWEPPSYCSDSEASETGVEADAVSGGKVCFGMKSEGRLRVVGIRLCVVAGIRDIHRPSSAAFAVLTRSRQRGFSGDVMVLPAPSIHTNTIVDA